MTRKRIVRFYSRGHVGYGHIIGRIPIECEVGKERKSLMKYTI